MEMAMVGIKGSITEGFRRAKYSLEKQMPFFTGLFPEVTHCYPATINVELEYALRVWKPDYTTPLISWAYPPGEQFSFLRIAFECPVGTGRRRAWIFIPHGSPHYHKLFQVEVLTEWIGDSPYGTPCFIYIPRDHREVPLIIVQ